MSNFKFGFSSCYVNALSKFMAKNDVRYYLCGINIKQHPEGGVILTATDGHTLVTIHDEAGFSDGEYIIPLSPKLIATAKKKGAWHKRAHSVLYDGELLHVTLKPLDKELDIRLSSETVLHSEFASPKDGKYPPLGGIFENLKPAAASLIGFDPELVGRIQHCTDVGISGAEFYICGENHQLVAISGSQRQFISVIMPMKLDDRLGSFDLPSHAQVHVDAYIKHKASLDNQTLSKVA